MAMIHPDDQKFCASNPVSDSAIRALFQSRVGSAPLSIQAASNLFASFNAIYLCEAIIESEGKPIPCVLRVARKAIPHIKTQNEVAFLKLAKQIGVPVPNIYFWDSGSNNEIGFEYIVMERIPYPSFDEVWRTLTEDQIDHVLAQVVEAFLALRKVRDLDGSTLQMGSLTLSAYGAVTTGPLVEETFWTIPDIERYWHALGLTEESFDTLNTTGPFPTYAQWLRASSLNYARQIEVHPRLDFARKLAAPLRELAAQFDPASRNRPHWIEKLDNNEGGAKLYLNHRDTHGGNILIDKDAKIRAFIDWEFAFVAPTFSKRGNPIHSLVSYFSPSPEMSSNSPHSDRTTWTSRFHQAFAEQDPDMHDMWKRELGVKSSIGQRGDALIDVQAYTRSIIEVSVRQWGRVKEGRGSWLDAAYNALKVLDCVDED